MACQRTEVVEVAKGRGLRPKRDQVWGTLSLIVQLFEIDAMVKKSREAL